MRSMVWLAAAALTLGLILPGGRAQAAAGFVDPQQVYTYKMLTQDLHKMTEVYPDLVTVRSIGKTPYGRELWAASLGHGPATLLINGAHHASEWLTANLVVTMLDRYAAAAVSGERFEDVDVRQLLDQVTIWFVPMVNPDGVTLAQQGVAAFPADAQATLLALNGGSHDFRSWKANAQGVDLNRQYPADWEHIVDNPGAAAPLNFKGEAPLTAPEAKALVAFTREIDPELVLAYHSAGRVIYWHFHTAPENVARDRRIADRFAELTRYDLVPPQENPSGGGYKDWFVAEFRRPGFTLEIGEYGDGTPLSVSAFDSEWARNRRVGLSAADEAFQLWLARNRVRLLVDGVEQPAGEEALLIGGQTFAPLPELLVRLGAKVNLDDAGMVLTATRDGAEIQLTVGSRRVLMGGNPLHMPNPPLKLLGRLYGPVRLVAEEMGATVAWDEATQSVQIRTRP